MPFTYEFHLNGTKLKNVELGFTTHRKWEEALDTMNMALPFYTSETPLPQLGLLEVRIARVEAYGSLVELESKKLEYLIIGDNVRNTSNYGVYRHEISAIEYTAKLDYYISNALSFTRPTKNNIPAPFEILDEKFIRHKGITTLAFFGVFLPRIDIVSTYKEGTITFEQTDKAYQSIGESSTPLISPYRMANVFIDTNMPNNTRQYISNSSVTLNTTKGDWYIDIGLDLVNYYGLADGQYPVKRFYIKVVSDENYTMYDLLDRVRNGISKFGTIETKEYHDITRIFDIDPNDAEYLKGIQAPQIYLGQATVRQTLTYLLSYINSLPRLIHGDDLDTLKLEKFNEYQGSFTVNDVVSYTGSQNTNQIGTKSYSALKQILPDDLGEPNIKAPSQSEFMKVRSTDIQMTDENFEVKLPTPLYMPIKLEQLIPRIELRPYEATEPTIPSTTIWTNVSEDLTARWINQEEWKLKNITDNFPSIDIPKLGQNRVGLRENMVDNLYWNIGDTTIKLTDMFGTIFREALITSVSQGAIIERLMRDGFEPSFTTFNGTPHIVNEYNLIIDDQAYKDLSFRVSYISLEDLVIKQDKEDLSQIDFYSEMRDNQDEQIINVSRQTRKSYGNLQRTGNKNFTFTKVHRTLDSMYDVGTVDVNEYVITDVVREHYNDYIISTYSVTKHHNRISQSTFVDQTYRWRDNYAKTVLDRHENYTDYLFIIPREGEPPIIGQSTLLGNRFAVEYTILRTLRSGFETHKSKATTALIRTDGMLNVYNETPTDRKAIMLPISSYGIKQGFAFTLGFMGNQVAGDGLIQKGINWYNQAVRYTDTQGEFTEFSFVIMADKTFNDEDSPNYDTYPLINATDLDSLKGSSLKYADGILNTPINQSGVNPLIVRKDVMTNFKLTYQIQMLSYYYGLYVIGQKFYTENFIVDDNEQYGSNRSIFLYLFKNNHQFKIFDDLIIPQGYDSRILLDINNLYFNADNNMAEIYFNGINLSGVTSWAIGNADNDLFIACNEGINGLKVVRRHFRPNVKEIGKRDLIIVEQQVDTTLRLGLNLNYVRGNSAVAQVDAKLNTVLALNYERGKSVVTDINTELVLNEGINYYRSHNPHLTMNTNIINDVNIAYVRGRDAFVSQTFDGKLNLDLSYIVGSNLTQSINSQLRITEGITYYRTKDIGEYINPTLRLNENISYVRGLEKTNTTNATLRLGLNLNYSTTMEKHINATSNATLRLGLNLGYIAEMKTPPPQILNVSQTSSGFNIITTWDVYNTFSSDAEIFTRTNTEDWYTPVFLEGYTSETFSKTNRPAPSPYHIYAQAQGGGHIAMSDLVSYTIW